MPEQALAVVNDEAIKLRFNSGKSLDTMKWDAESQYVTQIVSKNKDLQRCTSQSIGISLLDAAFSGLSLSPSLGHAYLIPYGSTCSFTPGYKGLLHLVYRAGTVKDVQALLVYQGDEFTVWTDDAGRHIKHVEKHTQGANVVAAYCIANFTNGGRNIEVMSGTELAAVEEQALKIGGMVWKGPWKGQMQRKAVIRRAAAYWPRDDGGYMEHALSVMSKYDPADPEFESQPLSEEPGETVVIASEEQIMGLHAALTDSGLDPKEADDWLQKKAESMGLTAIESIPADFVDPAKDSLMERLKVVMDRRHRKDNPDLFDGESK